MKYRIPLAVRYVLRIYLTGLLFFTVFRVLLCYTNTNALHEIPVGVLGGAFLMGLRFDTVISGYILALPTLLFIVAGYAGIRRRWFYTSVYTFTATLYTLSFLICCADIPFFKNYDNRLNISILNWTSSPAFVIKMILEEKTYLVYLLLFLLISAIFIFIIKRISKSHYQQVATEGTQDFHLLPFLMYLVFLAGIVLGIRGRVEAKSPILVGTAYCSHYSFANLAGLNPVFTFMQSWLDAGDAKNRQLHFMNDDAAIKLAQYYLHISPAARAASPMAREEHFEEAPEKYNVVLVIMESMSANYMQRFGNGDGLTPNLDRLATEGYSFDRFYSAGIHTFNGVFSTLFSFPALMARHTMQHTVIPTYTGLPWLMKQNGYQTIYFTTHDDQFDNIGGFLTANNFNRIISKKDYPAGEVVSTLGVPDHYMFHYSLAVLDKYYEWHQPFFATMMTASNHGPYTIPAGISFAPQHTNVRGGCVEYADWAIGQFIDSAARKPWFSNTLFVFVADHGAWEGDNFGDLAQSLNHIPCIVYCPALIKPQISNKPGGQIDVFPTIAGILHMPYTNNTMGIDLIHDDRKWIYFSQDDKIGVTDERYFYVWQANGREGLYNYADKKELTDSYKQKADSMKQFAFSMLQSTQWLLNNGKTKADNSNDVKRDVK